MALISPGVQVTVNDESQYIPSAVNTVPYFVIATAQNKISASGFGVAAGTVAANANKTYLITSQRDLTATFGVPFFYNTTNGTPINGYELNEYGLLAAYSALGISNRAYVQRVNVDLTELTASLSRPVGSPNANTFWLDTSTSVWGIQEWNRTNAAFTVKTPIVITDSTLVVDADAEDFTPLTTVGTIGDYAVVSVVGAILNPGYYKNNSNTWVLLGSREWQASWPTIAGTAAPGSLTTGWNMDINGIPVEVGVDATVAGFAAVINAAGIAGVTAGVTASKLVLYGDSLATYEENTNVISITAGEVGELLTELGLTAGEYITPIYQNSYSYQVPRWRTTDYVNTIPGGLSILGGRPTGSVWNNMSPVNNGINLKVKIYSATLGTWVPQNTGVYNSTALALFALDPSGGGKNISIGTTIALANAMYGTTTPNPAFSIQILEKAAIGQTVVTGLTVPVGNAFIPGNTFQLRATFAGSTNANSATVTIGGTGTVSDFISAVSAVSATVPYVTCTVNSAGNIVFTHTQGGLITLQDIVGTPINTAGFTVYTPFVRMDIANLYMMVLSTFVTTPQFVYTASDNSPDQDPADGRLWYYSTVDEVDIMIQNNGAWVGYQTVGNDVRGFDLALTNATGPISAATAPTTQNDAALSSLEFGDLWVDTSDLENYPMLYRWGPVNNVDQWVAVDTTDQVTENGVLFADARWAPNGSTDPIVDPKPSITSLLTSDYLDLDAPNPDLYPQGMLLWNTRRSGYNVKSFQVNYFNATTYPDDVLPSVTNTWLTASGNQDNGSMFSGRLAQRQMIVKALKSGIDTGLGAREDSAQFSLIATTGYPELTPNMIALSNERNNTLFVVGDTPMRLSGSGNDLVNWATNNNGLGLATGDGQVASSNYCANFYPSCQTTDLSGNNVVTAPSHMMVRTIIRSDEVSYPWLAPAGTRRGVIDNAIQLGYINAATGEFQPLSVSQSLRDILYSHNINPITFIPGVGITNFGNKTSVTTTTAMDRINVARLVAFLRGRLEDIGKMYLFEPNDTITRAQITNTCNSLMIDLVAKRAIYDYLVVCDNSNNTPSRIDRNELWVDIAIEPVKAVEFIYIPLRIKNTGAVAG